MIDTVSFMAGLLLGVGVVTLIVAFTGKRNRDEEADEHESLTTSTGEGTRLRWMSNQEIVNYVSTVASFDSLEYELAGRLERMMEIFGGGSRG